MRTAWNISFYSMMSAGYISADTYRSVSPKKLFCELTYSQCDLYPEEVAKELKCLFDDQTLSRNLFYLEKIENEALDSNSNAYEKLDYLLTRASYDVKFFIEKVGKRRFLSQYVYCTDEVLNELFSVNSANYFSLLDFRYDFKKEYEKECEIGYELKTSDYDSLIVREPISRSYLSDSRTPEPKATSPNGAKEETDFSGRDVFLIDKDAFDPNKIVDKGYVLFLYSLKPNDFRVFEEFLRNELDGFSIRNKHLMEMIGYRNFYVNYLFASDSKLSRVRHCGSKALNDFRWIKSILIDFVKSKYSDFDHNIIEELIQKEAEKEREQNKSLKDKLGEIKYKILLADFDTLSSNLSVRSQNCIKYYKSDFLEDFVNKNSDLRGMRNVGRKSEEELSVLVDTLRYKIAELETLDITEDETHWYEKVNIYGDLLDNYSHEYFSNNEHLPMFYLLEKFFKSLLSSNRDFQIYNLRSPIFKDKECKSLEEIADEWNLTRERVRQIYFRFRNHLCMADDKYETKKGLSLATFFENNNDWEYVIDKFQSYNYIDLSNLPDCCIQESHKFTEDFVFFIIAIIGGSFFIPIGKPILPYPTRSNREWNNCYLVKKELADKFDFVQLFELIKEYKKSNTEDLVASAREMIIDTFLPAWIVYDSNVVEAISEVVSNLLIQELGIIPDDQFCFTIESEKEKDAADIIYEILKANGDPLSCDELFQTINGIYPNRYKSPTSIKHIVWHDARLCSVGGNNLVALMEWDHVKLGSIRNIIVQYLEQFDEPQQAKDIVSYVQKYRDTSDNSVRATIGSGEQFVQFSGGYYGLSWKQYPEVFYLDESDRAFYKRVQELEQFLQVHNHFPFASSNPKEQDLHEWWLQIMSYIKLSKYQKDEVKRIETKYKNLARKKKHFPWFNNCNRYFEFIQEHHRRPSKSDPDEQALCIWLQKASEDFANGTLTQQQESCYLDLCKSL